MADPTVQPAIDTQTEVAKRPKVQRLREILLWPLLLDRPGNIKDRQKWLDDDVVRTLTGSCAVPGDPSPPRPGDAPTRRASSPWTEIKPPGDSVGPNELDFLRRLPDTDEETAYAEFVYFHPFVQRFLYGDRVRHGDSGERDLSPAFRLFNRTDVREVRIALGHPEVSDPPVLNVYRVHLYVTNLAVALLVVEIGGDDLSMELATLQELLDRFRRVYPPYWDGRGDRKYAGHCAARVQWLDQNSKPLFVEQPGFPREVLADSTGFVAFARENLLPPVSRVWEHLLSPLRPRTAGPTPTRGLQFRQIEDERIPVMAYIGVDDPTLLSRPDFLRLALLDESGEGSEYPYARGFLEGFEREHCYDRYWDLPWNDDQKRYEHPHRDWMTTRYMCCGYAFVVVGAAGDTGFFANSRTGLLAHFRHHYFQMGLAAHMHRASLLVFLERLSDVVHEERTEARRDRARDAIQEDFLHFLDLYWFPEISNQLQGRELFEMWKEHLGTQSLFEQVTQEIRTVNEARDAKKQGEQAEAANRLAIWGFPLVGVGIGVAVLALLRDLWGTTDPSGTPGWVAGWLLAFIPLAIFVSMLLQRFLTHSRKIDTALDDAIKDMSKHVR